MIQKKGNAVVFYAFYVASKVGKTGLSPTVDIHENGTEILSGQAATEVGDGLYKYQLAAGSVDANGEYTAVFKTTDSTVDQQHIPAMWVTPTWVDNVDVAISSRAAAGANVTVVNPVAQTSAVTVSVGSDYDADHGTALTWSNSTWTWTPTPTEVRLVVQRPGETVPTVSVTGSAPSATQLQVELTAAELNVDPGAYGYQVQVTRSNGRKEIAATGQFTVKPRYAAA